MYTRVAIKWQDFANVIPYKYRRPISNAPYKDDLEKIGDFDGGFYKHHFQN